MPDAFSLRGRVAVVTGGAGLLGPRFAAALASHGAKVALVDKAAAVKRTAAELKGAGEFPVSGYCADIRKPAAVLRLSRQVAEELGPADILVNNAAIKPAGFFDPFEAYTLRAWEAVLSVNLTGAMNCSQVFGAEMARRGRGSIVNIASIYGVVGSDQRIYRNSRYLGRAINNPAAYSASKAGLLGLTRHLAAYWGRSGVRVNAVTPGGVGSGQNSAFTRRYSNRVPLGRMARPEEISGAVVFLAGPAASYITGQNLIVDGGLTAW